MVAATGMDSRARSTNDIASEASGADDGSALLELLTDQLRDLLHAERQVLKALPKLQKAARTEQLAGVFSRHLAETETQVDRLTEALERLGASTRAKPCKGMQGLLEEGDENFVKVDQEG